MHDIGLLQDLVAILLVSILIIVTFHRIKVPPIIGFLMAGMVVGPYGLNLVSSVHDIEMLSEIGIIFLMFMIGIELSIKELIAMWKKVFIGGGLQVFGTILFTTIIGYFFEIPINESIFFGFLFSLSSTAIVLQLLQNRGEVKSLHGKMSVGILIFQDIIVVPMMLFIPILAGKSGNIWLEIGTLLAKITGVLLFIILLAKFVVPFLFKKIMKTKNQELFLVAVLALCFSIALLTNAVGLSLALGALFAGLIVSESDYSHQAVADVLPFRELFVSFFFISTGMLLNLQFFANHFLLISLLAIAVILIKMAVLWVTAFLLHNPPKSRLLLLLYLFQVGEFSLLLSGQGKEFGLLSDDNYQYFLAVSILTMAITPFILMASEPISKFILKRKTPIPSAEIPTLSVEENDLNEHLVIIGYGLNGENLAKAARNACIPYVIIEFSDEAFKRAKAHNEPVIFGDARKNVILKHTHIQHARAVAVAIGNPEATKEIVHNIRQYTKTAFIVVRTTQISEIEENIKLGADIVVPEEYETGIQMFTRVLQRYMIPLDEIRAYANALRLSNYSLLTTDEHCNINFKNFQIPEKGLYTLTVEQGVNSVVGKYVFESQIRERFGVNLLAIRRNNTYITDFTNQTKILQGDLLYVFGSISQIDEFNKKLSLCHKENE